SFANEFILYKHFIDYVFILIEADSKKAALEQCSKVHGDGLTLTWSVEEKAVNFLDLTVTMEAGYLSFKPYRKPLNSYERLPFTSAHPLHVKRAAFLGEVSRMARLCSRYPTYYTLPLVAGERAGHVTWRRVWRVWLNSLGTRDFRNRKFDPLARSGRAIK